jgi:serine phosphatase RsbU (regulator of sigma subunit)
MGRGIDAAAAMAQIRSTIRAYALDNADPADVFRKVDAYFDALDLAQLVTALYCLVDSSSGSITIANAGHLPPLLATGTACTVVDTVVGTPFGVRREDRGSTTVTLPRGAALVVVTDGLVERRGEDIDVGVAKLVEALRDTEGWSARRHLDHVVRVASADRQHDDDVTVLVLRRL